MSIIVRVISKEKLSQAGVVSCYGYYMERHAFEVMLNRRMLNSTYWW